MTVSIPLSKLVCGRNNPRRVKPERDAHRRLVASIRAHELLEPLIVRPIAEEDRYEVIAGRRRLDALRAIHIDDDPKVPCMLKRVDTATAKAISLSENFAREPMHPLDEAEAFATLASVDCKGVSEIAAEFGVGNQYVRQRMKLASLAEPIKAEYRAGNIDTGIAEAFAAVPAERQMEVWDELNGRPEDAEQVRTVIRERWIDAERALFDPATLPPSAVSGDLFGNRLRIERTAFMAAQRASLAAKREALIEDGWTEVVIAERAEVQDRLYSMRTPDMEYDEASRQKLDAINARREALQESPPEDDDEEQTAWDALDREEEEATANAQGSYSEAAKANGTVFLLLYPDGRVSTEYRIPRQQNADTSPPKQKPVPTSEELGDQQQLVAYTFEALAVREAAAASAIVLKRLQVLALHGAVDHDGLALRHQPNSTSEFAGNKEVLVSDAFDARQLAWREIDPLAARNGIPDAEAYRALRGLREDQLDSLIEMLTVGLLSGHPRRGTPLIQLLRDELKVDVRTQWRPDAKWLSGYRKCQLAHLIGQLRGAVYSHSALQRKKSELVTELDKLFADAATGSLENSELAQRINQWTPATLRELPEAHGDTE